MSSNLIKIHSENSDDTKQVDRYQILLTDFNNMKNRYEKQLGEIGREKECSIYAETILPVYQEIVRAYYNTYSKDLLRFKKMFEFYFEKANFTLMDAEYFKKYNEKENRPAIEDVAEVIRKLNLTNEGLLNNTVDFVFKIGLYDNIKKKVIVFPQVSVLVYE